MKKQVIRYAAFFMALNLLFEVVSPTLALALTNGPIQPEFTGFEPANASEMVDLFSGDFKYNIPLMDVDGYPLNLSYRAGENMEGEASWVGLGWSMNPGVLNRSVKGLPDDFNGESLHSETHIKPHVSMGLGFQKSKWLNAHVEFLDPGIGDDMGIGAGAQIGVDKSLVLTYNNYKGFGIEAQWDCNVSLSGNVGPASGFVAGGVGMTMSSQDGGTLSYQHSKGYGLLLYSASVGEGTSINTRTGAMAKTYFGNQSVGYGPFSIGLTTIHTLPAGAVAYSPRIANDYTGSGFGLSAKVGLWACAMLPFNLFKLKLNAGALAGLKGFYNKSGLATSTKDAPGYGYLYLENAKESAVMDFNRFRDGAISEEVPNGPMANKTYDYYAATAQGMGSSFRPFRSDIGIVHDPYNTDINLSVPISTEISVGEILHFILDIMEVNSYGYSGNWNTLINNNLDFKNKDVTQEVNRFYEKAYFKQFGEIAARDGAFDMGLGSETITTPILLGIATGFDATNGNGLSGAARTKRDIRSTNINYLTAKQADEYGFEKKLAYYDLRASGHSINSSTRMVDQKSSNISRTTKNVPSNPSANVGHHLSEISVTGTNGSRYVYGLPSYNLYKKRVMFNASSRKEGANQANGYPGTNYSQDTLNKSNSQQLVEYNPTNDLAANKRGYENLYQADVTPAYASSFLLTDILSTDYVDVTGDGPSYDDLGTFTKFNYSKTDSFGWREPYGAPAWTTANTLGKLSGSPAYQANLDKGLIADELDDKAFYEYGVRENYYLQSIETKNYVAFFECSARNDMLGVGDEHGTPAPSDTTYKLDQIKLYAKSDIIANGMNNAVPIKTVHFEYDYSLCPNTFNSSASSTHGKLTLKKVYFTYGNSQRSGLSPYTFYYGDNNHDNSIDTYGNPDYTTKAMDRWGNYKANPTNSGFSGDVTPDIGALGKLNNIEFPYSEQDEDLANQYAVAWNLTKIITPSSSVIEITYEADDYAYVQNQQAGQMLMINNAVNDVTTNDDVSGYSANTNLFDANFLIIDLSKLNTGIPASMPLADANTFVKSNLFKLQSDLYYKCFMKLAGPANSFGLHSTYYDYVPGYATVENAGLYSATAYPNNSYTKNGISYYKYAYVKIKKEIAYASTTVNPISLASWEYMRSFLPRIAYPGSEPANMGDQGHKPIKQLTNALVGLGVALADFATGISGHANYRFYFRNFCKEMDYSKSFVRAYVPYKRKKGGGYRIKQLLTHDSWKDMTTNTGTGNTEKGSVYGQSFDYTTLDADNKTVISSGVASYEPLVGGDEISLRKPITFEIEKKMAPNDHLFQEEPYGEMLFPAAMVGYSKVTVTPLANPDIGNLYKIGKSVFEFYTAKDYPIIETKGILQKQLFQNDLIQDFTVVSKAYKIFHATQSHVLKFNDMHGKLKAINTYGEDNLTTPISGTSYTYKDAAYTDGSRQLVTSAKTISEDNVISTEQIARDIDVTVDNRCNVNEATTQGNDFFLEISECMPFVNTHSSAIYGYDVFGLKSSITTKIIQQYGILEKSEVFDINSRTLSENLLWDRNTGNVVLNKVTNNLDQPVYNFNYPAYWMYQKMGPEFKREGIIIQVPANNSIPAPVWDRVSGSLSKASLTNPDVLSLGDEVVVYEANSPIINGKRYWVTYDYASFIGPATNNDNNFALVDADGIILNTTSTPALSLTNDHYIKVVKPAERNQLNASAGSISGFDIPALSGSSFGFSQKVISANVQTWCSGWNAYLKEGLSAQQNNCLYPTYDTLPSGTTRFNPYTAGMLGNWRPYQYFAYNVDRDYSNSQPDIKSDGLISSFNPYWTHYGSPYFFWLPTFNAAWIVMNQNTVQSPYGYLMESQDAIGLYHAQRYGFNHTLPILSASNARVRQVGFESFEDYLPYYNAINSCNIISNDQLDFYNQVSLSGTSKPLVTTSAAHTGRTSLSFLSGQNVTLTHYINKSPASYPPQTSITTHDGIDICGDDPALNKLNLTPGKYLVSFWVKGASAAMSYASNFSFSVEGQNGAGSPVTISGSPKLSGVINGWQKFDYEFTVPSSPAYAANSAVRFKFNASTAFNLDDFRVQPYNSSMVCTVYDPYQMRVWAQLDDNNYATLVEYDNQGMAVRKKKETLKGIYTLQETRQSTVKHN